jgi:hypothetical protein
MPVLLSSPVISADQCERRMTELLYEFYRAYFTGLPVDVGGNSRTFPALPANTAILTPWLFGQMEIKGHPDALVHTVYSDWRIMDGTLSDNAKLIRADVVMSLFVKAQNPMQGFQSADNTSRTIADGLRQIYETERVALSQRGIHHAKVRRGPVPVATPGLQTRMLVVTAQLHYQTAN